MDCVFTSSASPSPTFLPLIPKNLTFLWKKVSSGCLVLLYCSILRTLQGPLPSQRRLCALTSTISPRFRYFRWITVDYNKGFWKNKGQSSVVRLI